MTLSEENYIKDELKNNELVRDYIISGVFNKYSKEENLENNDLKIQLLKCSLDWAIPSLSYSFQDYLAEPKNEEIGRELEKDENLIFSKGLEILNSDILLEKLVFFYVSYGVYLANKLLPEHEDDNFFGAERMARWLNMTTDKHPDIESSQFKLEYKELFVKFINEYNKYGDILAGKVIDSVFSISDENVITRQEERLGVSVDMVAAAQESVRDNIKENSGIDIKNIVIEVGKEISWADIVNHSFRVIGFDRNGTIIDRNNKVKARGFFKPYGYLIAESPILNNRVKLPIVHRDDFLLAASVFDNQKLTSLSISDELIVTYSPEILLKNGLAGGFRHPLHYAIEPHGTLDHYYSMDNDINYGNPNPQKFFGPFVYNGEISVKINPLLNL
ncbi:MAG: hypothetical protein WCK37_04150 [Candidatus Falkowbacteria bacterium]